MKNSATKISDKASKRLQIGRLGIRKSLKIILTAALLLAATGARAGLLSSPMGVVYTNLDAAPVDIQDIGDGTIQINTNGMTGELTIQGSDFPPGYDIPTTSSLVLQFEQRLELVINLSLGVVDGRATAQIHADNENMFLVAGHTDSSGHGFMRLDADVQGSASCMTLNGVECGQLVLHLELRGFVTDPNDPSVVGKLGMEILGSVDMRNYDPGFFPDAWANARISANEGLINAWVKHKSPKGDTPVLE